MSERENVDKPTVCIITPVFNEQQGLPDYERRVREELFSDTSCDYSVLFVDDGSSDDSWRLIKDICARDQRFKALRLSRNFGSHAAIHAAFMETAFMEADAMVILACDLQDPPSAVLEMVEHWRQGADIVWGKRRSRQDATMRKLLSRMFYEMLKRYALPRNSRFTTGSFLLASRKVADCYRQFREHNRITFALVAWTGFDQEVVEYDREERRQGKSGWNFRRMIGAMYDAVVGFTTLPMRLMTLTGVCVSLLSFAFALYLVLNWLLQGTEMPGWPSLMLGITMFFGVQFLFMGVMGEYLSRIYLESVRRPSFFVTERLTPRAMDAPQTPAGQEPPRDATA